MLLLVWGGGAAPASKGRVQETRSRKKVNNNPPQIFNRKWTESCQKVNEKGGGGTPCLNGIFLWLGFLNSFPSLVVIVVRSFGTQERRATLPRGSSSWCEWHGQAKPGDLLSGPTFSYQVQLSFIRFNFLLSGPTFYLWIRK